MKYRSWPNETSVLYYSKYDTTVLQHLVHMERMCIPNLSKIGWKILLEIFEIFMTFFAKFVSPNFTQVRNTPLSRRNYEKLKKKIIFIKKDCRSLNFEEMCCHLLKLTDFLLLLLLQIIIIQHEIAHLGPFGARCLDLCRVFLRSRRWRMGRMEASPP